MTAVGIYNAPLIKYIARKCAPRPMPGSDQLCRLAGSCPLHRYQSPDRGVVERSSSQCGCDDAGCHTVDRDAPPRDLDGQRLPRGVNRLGGRVVGLSAVACQRAHGCNVDNSSPASTDHRQQRLRDVEESVQHDVDDAVPLLLRHARQRCVGRRAGIVDEDWMVAARAALQRRAVAPHRRHRMHRLRRTAAVAIVAAICSACSRRRCACTITCRPASASSRQIAEPISPVPRSPAHASRRRSLVSNTVTRPSARRTSCAVTLNLYRRVHRCCPPARPR